MGEAQVLDKVDGTALRRFFFVCELIIAHGKGSATTNTSLILNRREID